MYTIKHIVHKLEISSANFLYYSVQLTYWTHVKVPASDIWKGLMYKLHSSLSVTFTEYRSSASCFCRFVRTANGRKVKSVLSQSICWQFLNSVANQISTVDRITVSVFWGSTIRRAILPVCKNMSWPVSCTRFRGRRAPVMPPLNPPLHYIMPIAMFYIVTLIYRICYCNSVFVTIIMATANINGDVN